MDSTTNTKEELKAIPEDEPVYKATYDVDEEEEGEEAEATDYSVEFAEKDLAPLKKYPRLDMNSPPIPPEVDKSKLPMIADPSYFTTLINSGGYDPLPWTHAFDSKEEFSADEGVIPIYIARSTSTEDRPPVFLCLHGAGNTALSYGVLAKQLKSTGHVVAFDFRAHGDNTQANPEDLSVDTLIADTLKVITWVTRDKFAGSPLVLAGHSMGGAIAAKVSEKLAETKTVDLAGVVMLDAVEGTTMRNLKYMEHIVKMKVKKMASPQMAINFIVSMGQVQNFESARLNIPA
mmetsp:Transcript_33655/g.51941  ORF Transcript_33655/g.51941 Transcript_33655/m.51941 type:complete len:290 (+) Transcript_33655:24-893(+)